MDVYAKESESLIHSNNGAMCEFDQNKGIISVYFDKLEHCLTETGQKKGPEG